ncbi:alpha/beta fold hydrolase [Lentzea aerocolonigenes]|uniref:alpha/beta fold hydrolase n=1 Tax=Lentzea aerocolonigenes TaxID=68170 RepID=UPI00068F681C|nr:alpha/beta hydrolase [Lentzea aerocolonigenes]MCP2245873.1 Pimeloyl-ACP methyl ester carboxylesterase [Lentzea aerocolonigenes]
MRTTNVNGIELAYDDQGDGEPVLFVHGAIYADFLRPLAAQPAFGECRRIRHHRRGYGTTGGPAGGFDVQAADIIALMDHLDVDRAHVVGHSEGAMIALVLASSHPDRVRSLALLEPLPSSSWLVASEYAELLGTLGPAFEAMAGHYQAGDVAGAFDALFEPTGLDWRAAARAAGPGVVDQGMRDAATFVEGEAPALVGWSYGPEQAAVIDCPVLSWSAAPGNAITPATRAFLRELFPGCEESVLQGGDHFSVTTAPAAVAEPIAAFVSRHSAAATV